MDKEEGHSDSMTVHLCECCKEITVEMLFIIVSQARAQRGPAHFIQRKRRVLVKEVKTQADELGNIANVGKARLNKTTPRLVWLLIYNI